MADKRSLRLTVTISGSTSFIQVPTERAVALNTFLQSRGVSTSPPAPCTTGTDCIELRKGTSAKSVQALLDQWA